MKSSMESYSSSKSIGRYQRRCNSDSSDSVDRDNIPKKKRKHRHRRTESCDDEHSSDDDRQRKKKKKKKKTDHGRREKKSRGGKNVRPKRQSHDDEQSDTTCSGTSNSYVDNDRKERRRHEKSNPNKEATVKKHRRKNKKFREQKKENLQQPNTAIEFASALHNLLAQFQDMGEQLTTMLYRMSSGTSFDLDQVNPVQLRTLLTKLFQSLRRYGVEQSMEGSWHWLPAKNQAMLAPAERKRLEMALIDLVRQLLNDVGLTMDAINVYEKEEAEDLQKQKLQAQESKNKDICQGNPELIQALNNMLTAYGSSNSTEEANPPFELEISDLFESILQGEAVGLDGIPNESLRYDLENLFQLVGLEKVIEEEDDTTGTERHEIVYALPEDGEEADGCSSKARYYAIAIQHQCQQRVAGKACNTTPSLPQRVLIGPTDSSVLSNSNVKDNGTIIPFKEDDGDSSDDEGPAPALSEKSKRRLLIQKRRITNEEAKQLVRSERQSEAIDAGAEALGPPNSREEWMLFPGKHTFLEGILKKGPAVNRQFKNEKTLGKSAQRAGAHADPSVRKEMEQLIQLNQQQLLERGVPSLMQLHQEKIARESQKGDGKKREWKWSREGDLDKGRRIDKSALHSMLGSAEENLKTKFEGSFTSRFT
jgi:hypothetical protein